MSGWNPEDYASPEVKAAIKAIDNPTRPPSQPGREEVARKLASFDGNRFEGKFGPPMSEHDKEIYRKRADAILSLTKGTEPGAVTDDYVLMPREATRSMTMAGCDSLPSCEHVFGHAGEMLKNAYRKMVEVGARE